MVSRLLKIAGPSCLVALASILHLTSALAESSKQLASYTPLSGPTSPNSGGEVSIAEGDLIHYSRRHPLEPPTLPLSEVTALFNRITRSLSHHGFTNRSTLVVNNSEVPNAFARDQREVVISKGLLQRVVDTSEVAFIVAHECAHLALAHDTSGGVEAEVEADSLALRIVTELGFNPCSGSSVLRRLGAPYRSTLASFYPRLTALHHETFGKCG
jgi:predicted Zn-dependent protease